MEQKTIKTAPPLKTLSAGVTKTAPFDLGRRGLAMLHTDSAGFAERIKYRHKKSSGSEWRKFTLDYLTEPGTPQNALPQPQATSHSLALHVLFKIYAGAGGAAALTERGSPAAPGREGRSSSSPPSGQPARSPSQTAPAAAGQTGRPELARSQAGGSLKAPADARARPERPSMPSRAASLPARLIARQLGQLLSDTALKQELLETVFRAGRPSAAPSLPRLAPGGGKPAAMGGGGKAPESLTGGRASEELPSSQLERRFDSLLRAAETTRLAAPYATPQDGSSPGGSALDYAARTRGEMADSGEGRAIPSGARGAVYRFSPGGAQSVIPGVIFRTARGGVPSSAINNSGAPIFTQSVPFGTPGFASGSRGVPVSSQSALDGTPVFTQSAPFGTPGFAPGSRGVPVFTRSAPGGTPGFTEGAGLGAVFAGIPATGVYLGDIRLSSAQTGVLHQLRSGLPPGGARPAAGPGVARPGSTAGASGPRLASAPGRFGGDVDIGSVGSTGGAGVVGVGSSGSRRGQAPSAAFEELRGGPGFDGLETLRHTSPRRLAAGLNAESGFAGLSGPAAASIMEPRATGAAGGPGGLSGLWNLWSISIPAGAGSVGGQIGAGALTGMEFGGLLQSGLSHIGGLISRPSRIGVLSRFSDFDAGGTGQTDTLGRSLSRIGVLSRFSDFGAGGLSLTGVPAGAPYSAAGAAGLETPWGAYPRMSLSYFSDGEPGQPDAAAPAIAAGAKTGGRVPAAPAAALAKSLEKGLTKPLLEGLFGLSPGEGAASGASPRPSGRAPRIVPESARGHRSSGRAGDAFGLDETGAVSAPRGGVKRSHSGRFALSPGGLGRPIAGIPAVRRQVGGPDQASPAGTGAGPSFDAPGFAPLARAETSGRTAADQMLERAAYPGLVHKTEGEAVSAAGISSISRSGEGLAASAVEKALGRAAFGAFRSGMAALAGSRRSRAAIGPGAGVPSPSEMEGQPERAAIEHGAARGPGAAERLSRLGGRRLQPRDYAKMAVLSRTREQEEGESLSILEMLASPQSDMRSIFSPAEIVMFTPPAYMNQYGAAPSPVGRQDWKNIGWEQSGAGQSAGSRGRFKTAQQEAEEFFRAQAILREKAGRPFEKSTYGTVSGLPVPRYQPPDMTYKENPSDATGKLLSQQVQNPRSLNTPVKTTREVQTHGTGLSESEISKMVDRIYNKLESRIKAEKRRFGL